MNILVTKLARKTTSETLRSGFEKFGEVSAVELVMDSATNKSKGFGFVEMPKEEEAEEAISKMNKSKLDGQTIVVKKGRPRQSS